MRIILSSLFAAGWSLALCAGNPVTPKTSEVTVYRSGAKITSTATVKVPAGASEVVFENLSPHFNSNSLQVTIKGDARLNSAVFQLKSPEPAPEHPRAQAIRDSLTLLGDVLVQHEQENKVLDDEVQMLQKNSVRVGDASPGQASSLSVAELRELANYYRQRMLEIRDRQQKLTIAQRGIKILYDRLQAELRRLQPNAGNPGGEITLKIDAAGAQTLEIACTYLVNNAGWTPLYDLRSAGLDKSLQLTYKANVRNNTGFDWQNVLLHLSTAQPLSNNNRPIMNPVYVDFRPVAYSGDVLQQDAPGVNRGNIYQMKQINPAEVNAYVDGIRLPRGEAAPPVEPEEADFVTTFDLAAPQTILSDGKDNILTVEEKELPAAYEYHAVPKLEPAVFLLAKIADYGQYNLLPGQANIFFQETFVGQTWVNPQTTSDTLLLSLGRDEQLSIKRVQPKDFTERRKIFNSKIRETYLFEISIKNNKPKAVTIELLDQYPISKQKDIVVELEDKGGARVTPEFGKLEWSVEVPAGQTKKIRFSYSVEYPKGQGVGYFKE